MAEQHEKALVPQIRFTGFTDPWEQRKLGEIAAFGGGHTPSMSDPDNYEGGNVLWVTSQDVKSYYLDGTTTQITEKGAKELTLYPMGALVMVTRSGILRHTLPVAELCKPSTVNQDIRVILPQEDKCCGKWLLQFFISRNKELLLEFGKTGTTVESVDFSKMKDMILRMPSLSEQRQIGLYFARLDNLITLHQRKYDKLCVLKKSMLDKMFPKGGSLYPEIRFAGFTDPWEQRKLGQHLKLSRELGHTGVDARKLTVKLWGKGVVEKTDLYGGSAQTQYYIRHAGQFMYGKLDFLHAAFGVVPDKLDCFESTLDSPAFDIEGLDSSFLLNLVTQEDFYLKNGNIANGSRKAKRIHEETFLNMEIRAPELVEQRRIGAFLDRLDSLITLHQRKLELLRNIKKSMLDKMFV
ncbi:restriction endonuclease subunit S [Bifidobacterium adolescentis]|nr:restriction endonuclease subunit S [Bifidobacterium adolescentis]KAB5834023.1 restriction endonuclease subunit S [Bifidobacterium adolescentis]KAB5846891.1 restriction endonuclease subunit S [Bifidobacterium adolescentis]KAB5867433.1 restriction endonuclease subunit S [Bifidobacterium adolescentis]KAB5876486.1 restriction endonuclease subunit S [Bifidobacterium adolescentis]